MAAIAVVLVGVVIWKVWPSAANTGKSKSPKISVVHEVKNAPFNFMVPSPNAAWSYDEKSLTFDPDKGVMKYILRLNFAQADLTVSQQVMPDELKVPKSSKLSAFIQASNVVRSQQAGDGTLYFVAALQNGAQANGADAVIYATDDILLFGRTGSILGYDAWANLMASMRKQASK
jgi:hypothetical protein